MCGDGATSGAWRSGWHPAPRHPAGQRPPKHLPARRRSTTLPRRAWRIRRTLRAEGPWVDCLMTNRVHLVVVPERDDALSQALGNTHQRHAQRFNQRYRRSGHVWQNRFFSCALGPDRAAVALAYGDLNPMRAGLAPRAEQWEWSSARAHGASGRDEGGLLDLDACRRWVGSRGLGHDLGLRRASAAEANEELRRAQPLRASRTATTDSSINWSDREKPATEAARPPTATDEERLNMSPSPVRKLSFFFLAQAIASSIAGCATCISAA